MVLRRLLCAVAITLSISTGCAESCAAASGGQPGARAQLRFVDVSDERVIFLFGLAAGGGFGLPTYAVQRGGSLLHRALRRRVDDQRGRVGKLRRIA